ncbi:hypothetical protein KC19_5G025700 [Ceratodon purpureus]|uniref:Galactose oxidase n=2 Tax=Ceratodon purpureus TaxID=3225 RepID=A0A8T0HYI2_CERPU|nr:hypothetical protein KC19_5G025700 [Ceratodon purpureus]KAG0575722.1 hypothetical protein KC19_5G025700 [Ceratodon purpureus]
MAVRDELGRAKSRSTKFRVQNTSSMGWRSTSKHWWLWMQVVVVLVVLASEFGVHGQDLGTWEILLANAGIASMHAAVTNYGTVVLLDRTNIGASQIALPNGTCRDSNDLVLPHDCTAHSVLFDPSTNTVRPLTILSDTWCSSGQFMPDGTLMQTGGDFEGIRKVRTFVPCPATGNCDWVESTTQQLQQPRWYATNQLLPDGRQIIIGGRAVFNIEYIPPSANGPLYFDFLNATNDGQNDNLYPFVHLLPDGNLYIFANRDSIVYNYVTNTVVKTFPRIPGEPRNYPSAGSSVMLPLLASNQFSVVEVLICGGAQYGAFLEPWTRKPCSITCERIVVTDPNPIWVEEQMPIRRCMGDMILLPNTDVLIINGASIGSQGWGFADDPVLNPVRYMPYGSPDARFTTLTPSTIPRMYHSTANLLPDGRVMCAGSNSHQFYTFTGDYPTELRIDAFSPPYLSASVAPIKPTISVYPLQVTYGTPFTVTVSTPSALTTVIELNLMSAPFNTHSYAQGQRLVNLNVGGSVQVAAASVYQITATAPPTPQIAPPGYYMMFAVNQRVPSVAVWIRVTS